MLKMMKRSESLPARFEEQISKENGRENFGKILVRKFRGKGFGQQKCFGEDFWERGFERHFR